jgi:hypothetical protein
MIKFIVISAVALFVGGKAFAVGGCGTVLVGSSCWQAAQNDSSNGTVCDLNGGCTCADAGGTLKASSPCWTNWYEVGYAQNGKLCCVNGQATPSAQPVIKSLGSNGGLAEVFMPKTSEFYGYVGSTNRSGNYGRTTSIKARLDICMGNLDTDSAIATNNANTCYNQYCGTSYNEYCNSSGSDGGWSGTGAVCHDRCECAINGVGDSSCNQL